MSYGLPAGSSVVYGGAGFPEWVMKLAAAFGLKASTYPSHQESDRLEKGYAPNPEGLNRGIDWAGSVADMQRFAEYLLSIRGSLEQVIWENPSTGRRIGVAGGVDVSATPYFAAEWADHRDHVHTRQSAPIPLPGKEQTVTLRPDFNEYPIWSTNCDSRGSTKVDMFLLHTEEGGPVKGGADRLARWLGDPSRQVSYHYTISEDPDDHGVTVVDVVDTDLAAWSCLGGNRRSINMVYAGSKAAWTRDEWLRYASRAIDVSAYLAAQDAAKYSIPMRVIKPPYGPPGGVSDHRYVTRYLRDGTHTDVGGPMAPPWTGFPWDVFEAAFLKYCGKPAPTKPVPDLVPVTPAPPAPPAPPALSQLSDRQLLEAIYLKLDRLVVK